MNQRFDAFVTGITVCYKYIQRIKSAEVTDLGLKGTHVMILFYLKAHPEGLTSSQLCSLCSEDKAAISRSVAFLRERGYVYTQENKTYRAPLFLTQEGLALAEHIDTVIADWVCDGGDGLTDLERRDFYSGLQRITQNLRSRIEGDPKFTET